MRIAMFEGYGFHAADDPAVEGLIRESVSVLQNVQRSLWDAYNRWSTYGVFGPRIGAYDWREAVNAWQGSVDLWWGETLTDAVRADPYAVGADGKTRIQAWIDMGHRLIPWAQDIGKRMDDDTFLADVYRWEKTFRDVVTRFVKEGVRITLGLIPDWMKVLGAAVGAYVVWDKFLRKR